MKYEIRARKVGTQDWQGYFSANTPEEIVSLASQLEGYELKVSSVGHAIETIHHPHKASIVKRILANTLCMAPVEAPFEFTVHGWSRDANEAIIRWTFDNLVSDFKIDVISADEPNRAGRVRYTIEVIR